MSSSLFEIVELLNGAVGLRRAGDDGEPLVSIKFSKETADYLQESRFEVVKAMIEAGMEALSELEQEDDSEYQLEVESRMLH